MSQNAIEEIELSIQEAQAFVDKGKALERLRHNRDFQAVVLEGYLKDEAVRLVHLKNAPNVQSEQVQRSIVKQIDAVGVFTQFLNTVHRQAEEAQYAIDSGEEEIEAARAEEVE